MSNIESFAISFLANGESDMSDLTPTKREAIIRERFKDEPWIITFALDMQGVHYATDLDDIERDATDSYQGEWNDVADFASDLLEEAYSEYLEALPGFLRYHIDYAAIGRDMELGGEIDTFDTDNGNSIYVFNTSW